VLGSNHKYVLPGSILLGGNILMLADISARTWLAPAELPIGIITALLGAPFFLLLIIREKHF
jgi:iron complex transport system permease protein